MNDAGAPDCDDLEPCTEDVVAERGVCQHRAAQDGAVCDDQNVCTQGDHCLAGRCEGGLPVTGAPEVLSVSTPTFQGQGLGVGRDRFLFRSDLQGTLTLARVVGEGFESLDQIKASIRGAFWLVDDLLAYSDSQGGGLIDLSENKIQLRGQFTAASGEPNHFALTHHRLWVCLSTSNLLELEVENWDELEQIGEVSIPGGCRALAPSGDGEQVYVSTQGDTLIVAPQAGGLATVAGSLGIPSHSVHARHGYIALSSSAAVVVLRESDRAEIARLSGSFSNSRVTTRGLEVIDYRAQPEVTDVMFSVYEIDEGAAEPLKLRGSQVLKTLQGRVSAQPSVWASCDDALMDEPHVYRLSERAPFLSEIRDPGLAWPGWLRVEGNTIYMRDSLRAVTVDVQDAAHPRAVFGGPFPKPLTGSSLEIPKQSELALFGDPALNDFNPRTRMLRALSDVHLRGFDADQRPIEGPQLALASEPGDTWITRRKLYQLQPSSAAPVTSFRLLGWDAAALASDALASPELDRSFDSPAGYELDTLARIHGDDATAFDYKVVGSVAPASRVYWTRLAGDQRVLGPLALDLNVWDLAVSGDRVMAMGFVPSNAGKLNVTFISAERRGDALVEGQPHQLADSHRRRSNPARHLRRPATPRLRRPSRLRPARIRHDRHSRSRRRRRALRLQHRRPRRLPTQYERRPLVVFDERPWPRVLTPQRPVHRPPVLRMRG